MAFTEKQTREIATNIYRNIFIVVLVSNFGWLVLATA
jgi:hypothetical protein